MPRVQIEEEGGTCLSSFPAGTTESQQGGIVHDPSHLIDLMATFLDASGAHYPTEVAGVEIQPMEGVSLLPALSGKPLTRDSALGFEHHGNLALRDGRWKIVSAYRNDQPTQWEMCDMEAGRSELNDLSTTHPEKKQELIDKWQAWADRVGVQPWPFPPRK